MDADQAKRFDAFQSVILPKYVVRKVSLCLFAYQSSTGSLSFGTDHSKGQPRAI